MPLYEFYCERCNGIFETIRQMRDASLPAPCPECNHEAPRIMSAFNAFVMRDGYPRRLPDKGTFWHMEKEVKTRARRMKGWTHPELAEPKPEPRPLKGETAVQREQRLAQLSDARYRGRWGVDQYGFRTVKAKKKKPVKKTLAP